MCLPELDQEAVKVQPQLTGCFPDEFPDVGEDLGDGQVERDMNRLPKISMVGCDGLECRDDPSDSPWSGPKNQIVEFRRF
jgi:hypothetical protein